MADYIERKDLWLEVERIAADWSQSVGATHPTFPLERLRPLWNSNHRLMTSDHQKLEALEHENMRLKFELAKTKLLLEHGNVEPTLVSTNRRRADCAHS